MIDPDEVKVTKALDLLSTASVKGNRAYVALVCTTGRDGLPKTAIASSGDTEMLGRHLGAVVSSVNSVFAEKGVRVRVQLRMELHDSPPQRNVTRNLEKAQAAVEAHRRRRSE